MSTSRGSRAAQRGVTLIEAGMVVAIGAIVASSVAPSFQGFIDKQRLDGLAAQLATDIQFARAEAVLRNTGVRLTVQSQAWGSCYVVHTGAANQCSCSAGGPAACTGDARQIRTVQLISSDRIALSGVSSMLFDPVHGTSTPTGTFRLLSARSGRAVHHVVNVMGRVRTCSPQGSAAPVPGYTIC